jgi:hypothetical protein
VLELMNGRYVERAVLKGEATFDAAVPFPMRISLAGTLRGDR